CCDAACLRGTFCVMRGLGLRPRTFPSKPEPHFSGHKPRSQGVCLPMLSSADEPRLLSLVQRANDGDRGAVSHLMAAIRDDVYYLSMRFLGHPSDADDATQEILVKVM